MVSIAAHPQNSLMHPSWSTQRVSNMYLLSHDMRSDGKDARHSTEAAMDHRGPSDHWDQHSSAGTGELTLGQQPRPFSTDRWN